MYEPSRIILFYVVLPALAGVVLWLGSRYERDLPIRFPWVRRGRLVIRTVQRRPYVDRLNAEIRRENRASIGNPRRQLRTKEDFQADPSRLRR